MVKRKPLPKPDVRARLNLIPPGTAQDVLDGRSARSKAGSADAWTAAQLAAWGIPWPSPRGWRQHLLLRRLAYDRKLRARG